MFNIIYKMKIWCLIGSFQYKDSVNYLTLNHKSKWQIKKETWELILDILTKEVVQKFVTIFFFFNIFFYFHLKHKY